MLDPRRRKMVLIQGNNSPRGGGGTPIEGERQLVFLVSGDYAWNMQGDNVIPAPAAGPRYDSSRSGSPPHFLKPSMAGKKAISAVSIRSEC